MKLLEKLFDTSSVAGYETEMKKLIKNEIKDYCDNIYEDNFGNLIAEKGNKGEHIAINTPISEDGLFVTSFKEGNAKCSPIGNPDPSKLSYGKFITSEGIKATGVLKGDKKEKYDIADMDFDFFDNSAEIGDILAPVSVISVNGKYVSGKSAGIKSGIYTLINIIKNVKSQDKKYSFIFSVEDNLGFKGAKTAFGTLNPDYGYIIHISDDSNKNTPIKLGEGPSLKLLDKSVVFSKKIINELLSKINLSKYQKEITPEELLTNNRVLYLNNGIPVININVPVRYNGSFAETFSMDDTEILINAFK